MFQKFQSKRFEKKPTVFVALYTLTARFGCNFQRQHEFNPPHDHDGKLSFVIYLSIPVAIKKRKRRYKGKFCEIEVDKYSLCMAKDLEIV